jgi:hypothetical protein
LSFDDEAGRTIEQAWAEWRSLENPQDGEANTNIECGKFMYKLEFHSMMQTNK